MKPTVDLQRLLSGMTGSVIRPGDSGYDRARRIWNGMIDRHPLAIAKTTSVADVQAAVSWSRDAQVPVAVRCGGHSMVCAAAAETSASSPSLSSACTGSDRSASSAATSLLTTPSTCCRCGARRCPPRQMN